MKDKVLMHAGSVLGGVIHNLNTPLMWIMGRSQLVQARNESFESLKDLPDEDIQRIKEKNAKDIASISEGAERIDQILKAIGYKVQMANEGSTSLELREYLAMEINFMMADMRFKHETKREEAFAQARSCYVKADYNALSWAVVSTITTMIDATDKGRTLRVTLDNEGLIHIACPQMRPTPQTRERIDEACRALSRAADIRMHDTEGFELVIALKDA